MDIDKRDRTELKAYFVKNAIPTESNFAELIDGALSQKDDGIVKLPGDPLSIQASGDAASQKKAINFYESFADPNPAWVLSLNPRSDPSDPATARAGFNISDGAGQSRLFIDRTTGKVGIGTANPGSKLHIEDTGEIYPLARVRATASTGYATLEYKTDIREWRAGVGGSEVAEVADKWYIHNGQFRLVVDNAGNVGIGTTTPQSRLDVAGSLAVTDGVSIGGPVSVGGDVSIGGVVAQEAWISPPLQNGWANYAPTHNNSAGYFKDSMGVVHLRGIVRDGGLGEIIFTLPPGYWPPRREWFVVTSGRNYGFGCVQVSSNGQVHPRAGDSALLSLDGITFRAA